MTTMQPLDPRASGMLSRALTRLIMKRATVTANETLADRFHLITLEGPGLVDVAWMPGQKIQIAMGSAFVARTYTPVAWNAAAGRTCILGYAHGAGPGSAWLRAAVPGSQCDIFGPRASLDVASPSGPLAIFGDETSLGLAHAVASSGESAGVTGLFEVGDVAASRSVAAQLAVETPALLARAADDAHLFEVESQLPALVNAGTTFVLTGRAKSVQRIRQTLKALAVPAQRVRSKAYWAAGKTGLD